MTKIELALEDLTPKTRLELFLGELTVLTKKYGLAIGGCGCCGSPWIETLGGERLVGDELWFDITAGIYKVEAAE